MKSNWRQYLQPLLDRYASFGLLERVLCVATLCATLGLAIDTVALLPMRDAAAVTARQAERALAETSLLQRQVVSLGGSRGQDPRRALRTRLQLVERDVRQLDEMLDEQTRLLVRPGEMAALLEDVLKRHSGVRLVRARSRTPVAVAAVPSVAGPGLGAPVDGNQSGATPVGTANNGASASEPDVALFQHGLQVEVEGNYLAALRYLEDLEALPWDLIWQKAEFAVTEFPRGRLTIEVSTLSPDRQWIGLR